jgi:hypothetical protein
VRLRRRDRTEIELRLLLLHLPWVCEVCVHACVRACVRARARAWEGVRVIRCALGVGVGVGVGPREGWLSLLLSLAYYLLTYLCRLGRVPVHLLREDLLAATVPHRGQCLHQQLGATFKHLR